MCLKECERTMCDGVSVGVGVGVCMCVCGCVGVCV